MPTAARHTGSRPDEDTIALIDEVWGRLQARIERGLSRIERLVSALFDRMLEPTEIQEAVELSEAIASKLGTLGLAATAELLRKAANEFERPDLGTSSAVVLATMLDDVRVAMATSVSETKQISHSDRPLAVVGAVSEIVDELLWVAASQGLPVSHHVDGVSSTGHETAAVLVVVEDPDLSRARSMLRGVREVHPSEPIVLVAPEGRLEDRARVADIVTSVLPITARPLEVVTEVRGEVIRSRQEQTVVILGDGGAKVVEVLEARGLKALLAKSAEDLIGLVRSGKARAAVLTPDTGLIEPTGLLRMIRADRETRATVVALIGDTRSGNRAHAALRNGADAYFTAGLDADDLAVELKARLLRRAQLEPIVETSTQSGTVSWSTAVVMIERMILTSFRQSAPVGLAMIRLSAEIGDEGLDNDIAREFRGDDVISRLDDEHLVIALQGVNRRVLMGRLNDIYREFSLDEQRIRTVGLEFPVDGRSLEELVELGRACLDRAEIDKAPDIVGADWKPWTQSAPDVMLIDPDRTLGKVLTAALSRRGLNVVHHLDALDALDELSSKSEVPLPRVVLMELDQRGLDGLQMLRRLRESGVLSRFKVIILSSRSQEAELQRAFEFGADDFVPKPFSTPLLIHRLNRALEN